MDSSVAASFFLLLPSIPIAGVYLVGIIFSATKLGTHRKAAVLALVGFGLLLLAAIVHAGGSLLTLPQYRGTLDVRELGVRLAAINLISMLMTVGGTIVLLLAIFADREKKQVI